MSGPHEEATPGSATPAHRDQPELVESVPLFPGAVPPVPPLPATESSPPDASPLPQPPYRRTRAAAREQREQEVVTSPAEAPSTAPTPIAPPTAVPAPAAPTITVPPHVAAPPSPVAPAPAAPASSTPASSATSDTAPQRILSTPPPAAAPLAAPPLAAPPATPPSALPHNAADRNAAVFPATPSAPAPSAPSGPAQSVSAIFAAGAPPVIEPASRREQRVLRDRSSFLQTERPEEPAREGARGALNRLGLRIRPSAEEQSARDDELAVSQHWPGPRTIAVVNGKGGAGKTPTTILLSAVFARYGGAGVLAWDNNQTRGTLGWRTDTGAHDRTLLEMLPEVGRLLGTGAQSADLAHFMHHQPREKYDVLRSKPIKLAHENRLSPADVDAIHAVAAKFYRLIIIDSGNDESDPMWLRMIDHADQLVVATTTRADHAEAGALLIEALEDRDERSARLAQEAVVVVSQADPKATPSEVEHVVSGYRALARDVVSVPFDHEMVDGHLRYGALAKRTQRAWLSAAASVARGF